MFQRKSNRAVEEKFNLISGFSGWRVYKPKLVFDYLKNSSGKMSALFTAASILSCRSCRVNWHVPAGGVLLFNLLSLSLSLSSNNIIRHPLYTHTLSLDPVVCVYTPRQIHDPGLGFFFCQIISNCARISTEDICRPKSPIIQWFLNHQLLPLLIWNWSGNTR